MYSAAWAFWRSYSPGPVSLPLWAGGVFQWMRLVVTPIAQAYKIGALPHFRIYDKHRRLRHILVGNDTLAAADLARQLLAEP